MTENFIGEICFCSNIKFLLGGGNPGGPPGPPGPPGGFFPFGGGGSPSGKSGGSSGKSSSSRGKPSGGKPPGGKPSRGKSLEGISSRGGLGKLFGGFPWKWTFWKVPSIWFFIHINFKIRYNTFINFFSI